MSGERKGAREAIDRCVKQWVSDGMEPKTARERAVKAAQDHDKKNPK